MLVWRLVISKIATLKELETIYTVEDILLANQALDMQQEIDSIISESEK
jgi:hypothetical protein